MTLEEAIEQSDRAFKEVGYRIEGLSGMDKVIHLITVLNFELANGGMTQWLLNQGGGFAMETIDALRQIGAVQTAQCLNKVLKTFPSSEIPSDKIRRQELVNRLEPDMRNSWNEITDLILDWPEDVDTLLRQFVAKEVNPRANQ